jgi:hypothetical protein
MKNLALIMMFSVTSVMLSAEEFTIQTISAKKEASITPAFEKKVHQSTLSSEKKKEGSCNIVTVGKYPSAKAAQHDLKKAKMIAKDAFVRPLNRATPKGCETQSAATDAKKATEAHPSEKISAAYVVTTPVVKKEEGSPVQSHEIATAPVANSMSTSQKVNVTPVTQEVKGEPCKVQPCQNVTNSVYVYDRNLARKSDIQEAIEYYKRSPYHTFKPVLTQR